MRPKSMKECAVCGAETRYWTATGGMVYVGQSKVRRKLCERCLVNERERHERQDAATARRRAVTAGGAPA